MYTERSMRSSCWLAVLAAGLALGAVSIVLAPHGRRAAAQTPAEQTPAEMSQARSIADQFSQLFEAASQKVSPAVVPIFAEQTVAMTNVLGGPEDPFRQFFGDDFFKRFFGTLQGGEQSKQTVRSVGSGVIVSSDGYILTNNHVISGAEKLTVVMEDGKKYTAKVVGADPQTDVAVIKIDGRDFPAVDLGNSDNVKIGQWVIAVGNPFQLLHSVTAGIISAKGRSSIGLAAYEDFIQTDASINPGNSGGALADLDGNVIGINTAISSPSGASAGVGFAMPINMAQRVMEALIDKGKVTRGYLALVPQDIDDNLANAMKLKSTEGALVGDVTPGGPADKAGLKRGDVIVQYEGQKIKNSTELRNQVAQTAPKSKVDLAVLRDGHEIQLTATLGERPVEGGEKTQPEQEQAPEMHQKLGLEVQDLTPDIAQELGYGDDRGAGVASVEPGSPGSDAGLRRGDLIKEVNHKKITTVREFTRALADSHKDDTALLLVRRGQNTFFVAVEIS